MLHSQLIEQTGGTPGVRDFNLFESTIDTPFQAFGGEDLYPTIQAKGTRLGFGLIKNHCMLDGNKHIGPHAMFVFFALNGIPFSVVLPKAVNSMNVDIMSVSQIHQKLEKDYSDIEKGNVEDTASAFVVFRDRH